jgi:hypothetical protein
LTRPEIIEPSSVYPYDMERTTSTLSDRLAEYPWTDMFWIIWILKCARIACSSPLPLPACLVLPIVTWYWGGRLCTVSH